MFLDKNVLDTMKVRGEFSIILEKEDGSIEKYEEKNLIMDLARETMAELIGGWSDGSAINKFVLGTLGHIDDDILNYKRVGENGFDTTRTQTFAEADSSANYFTFGFDVRSSSSSASDTDKGYMRKQSKDDGVDCDVSREVSGRTVTYTFDIPKEAANNDSSDNDTIAYTEAAMYAGDKIFSMKTFPARVKESSVSMKIIWSIIF